jgi:hypothetical protein
VTQTFKLEVEKPKTELGRLLIMQSGATRSNSIYSIVLTTGCWVVGFPVLLMSPADELSVIAYVLIATGALPLLNLLWHRMQWIACYEHGLIVKKFLKSRTIMHSDIAGVEFLTLPSYRSGIYKGTTSHLEIMPRLEDSVKLDIWGSKKDGGERIANIVQVILTANPDAQLLKIRGYDL